MTRLLLVEVSAAAGRIRGVAGVMIGVVLPLSPGGVVPGATAASDCAYVSCSTALSVVSRGTRRMGNVAWSSLSAYTKRGFCRMGQKMSHLLCFVSVHEKPAPASGFGEPSSQTHLDQGPRVALFLLVGPHCSFTAHNVLFKGALGDKNVNVGRPSLSNTVDTLLSAPARELKAHLDSLRLHVQAPNGRNEDHAVGSGQGQAASSKLELEQAHAHAWRRKVLECGLALSCWHFGTSVRPGVS